MGQEMLPRRGYVDVWRFDLTEPSCRQGRAVLSTEEHARAGKFADPTVASRFIYSRIILRSVIGNYLDRDSAEITFTYNQQGKPFVETQKDQPELKFNMARSGECMLIGITEGFDIGIDIESTKHDRDIRAIARRFFTPDEARLLGNLENKAMQKAFLRCWTRKEALMKANGQGMALINKIEPGFKDLPKGIGHSEISGQWYQFSDIAPVKGQYAAVAVAGELMGITFKSAENSNSIFE